MNLVLCFDKRVPWILDIHGPKIYFYHNIAILFIKYCVRNGPYKVTQSPLFTTHIKEVWVWIPKTSSLMYHVNVFKAISLFAKSCRAPKNSHI